MCDVLDSINDEAVIERIKGKFSTSAHVTRFTHKRNGDLLQCARCSCWMRHEHLLRPTKFANSIYCNLRVGLISVAHQAFFVYDHQGFLREAFLRYRAINLS